MKKKHYFEVRRDLETGKSNLICMSKKEGRSVFLYVDEQKLFSDPSWVMSFGRENISKFAKYLEMCFCEKKISFETYKAVAEYLMENFYFYQQPSGIYNYEDTVYFSKPQAVIAVMSDLFGTVVMAFKRNPDNMEQCKETYYDLEYSMSGLIESRVEPYIKGGQVYGFRTNWNDNVYPLTSKKEYLYPLIECAKVVYSELLRHIENVSKTW